MRREDLFEAIGMVEEERLARSNNHRNPSVNWPMEGSKMRTYSATSDSAERRKPSKLRVVAALVAVLAMLAGSVTVIRYMIAKALSNDTAQTEVTQLTKEHIQLAVDEVTSLSMRITCTIDRENANLDYVPIQTAAPYTIERQTENGWEPLELKEKVWSEDPGTVMVWDSYVWTIEWFDAYSILESGTYRFTTAVVEELGPMSVEFTVGPQFTTSNVHLSVGEVTPTSMRVYCTVDRNIQTFGYVTINWDGPYTIEKKTEDGWELLQQKADDWGQSNTPAMVWDEFDWPVNWSAVYGTLESGAYRYTISLVEGMEPLSVVFEVPKQKDDTIVNAVNSLLNEEAYCIYYTYSYDYGSPDQYPQEGWPRIQESMENAEKARLEYWKSGDDFLYLTYSGDRIDVGLMYKDGIGYFLDHEGDDYTNPVIGWSQNPALDISRFTQWNYALLRPDFVGEVEYGEDGKVKRIVGVREGVGFEGTLDAHYVGTTVWDVVTTDPALAAAKLAEQDVNVARPFSWEEDVANMPARDVEFVNTTAQPVATASEAIALAQEECTVAYTKIIVYRDEDAGMWKVEFQMEYGYHGYQYIYLDDEGITQMISGAGSKVAHWQQEFPGP